MKAELAPAVFGLFQNISADDIGRHQVRRELDARELQVEHIAQGADQHSLAQARHAFQQGMPPSQHANNDAAQDITLPDDDLADFFFDVPGDFAELLQADFCSAHLPVAFMLVADSARHYSLKCADSERWES